jgi:5-methylthioadenosine/S-adenosylhomocysteine deaminase
LSDAELALFAQKDVKVSYNPAAAMRVLGFAKIPEMLERGICVSLGTDGAPANNRMTLIDDMWLASLINKGRSLNPTVMPAETMLAMVTRNAAKSILWDNQLGSLEVGKAADLILVNPNSATMLPMHDPIANMVSSLRADNVESTMVAGRWLMKNRQILGINEADILQEAKTRASSLKARAGISLKPRFHTL